MKIQIASDLHLEGQPGHRPPPEDFVPVADRDVLVLAGDIGEYTNAIGFIKDEARTSPVIYVPGNHEYQTRWGRKATEQFWREMAKENENLFYLDGEGVLLDDIRFWGGAWYSDLGGRQDAGFLGMIHASIADFEEPYNDNGHWNIIRHIEEHRRQTELLRLEARQVDVVITHWPPTQHAIAPRFKGHSLNSYFANDHEDLVREIGAQVWISGHVHEPHEAMVGDTRCIGNPSGYADEVLEGKGFRPDRIVEVQPRRTQWVYRTDAMPRDVARDLEESFRISKPSREAEQFNEEWTERSE